MKKLIPLLLFILCQTAMTAKTYPERIKELITRIEERADVDPDSFAVDVKQLEAELQKLEKPQPSLPATASATMRAIVHGVLATAYEQMKYSHISHFDAETQEGYTRLAREHMGHVMDDMESLAAERSKDYEPLVKLGDGGRYFSHNMLVVMLDFEEAHAHILENRTEGQSPVLQEHLAQARRIFQARGDRNSDTMLRLRELQRQIYSTAAERQQYCRQLEALRDSTRDLDAGKLVANTLELEVNSIMATNIQLKVEENVLPGKPFHIGIEAENARQVTLQVLQYNGTDKQHRLRVDGKRIDKRSYTLSPAEAIEQGRRQYMAVRDSLNDSLTLAPGKYVLLATTAESTSTHLLDITSLHHAVFYTPDGQAHAYALDRITGRPLKDIVVMLYKKYNTDLHDTFRSDKNGEVTFHAKGYQRLRLVRDASLLGTWQEDATEISYIHYYNPAIEQKEQVHGNLFTDRGIYRPGQTIHVSALLYTMLGDDTRVATGGDCLVSLRNPDGEETLSDTLRPDGIGTLACDFVLPAKCKLGSYRLTLKKYDEASGHWQHIQSCSVSIEEYKRPTYIAEFQRDTTLYALEDSIRAVLTAETYAGIPVSGAKIHYTIDVAKQRFWVWRNTNWQVVQTADAETDATGKYAIGFRPLSSDRVQQLADQAYEGEKLQVRITATLTDNAGESHQAVIHYQIPLKPRAEAPQPKPDPLQLSKKEAQPGETIDIRYTPEDTDAYVFYYVVAGGRLIEHERQTVNGTLHKRLRCKKEWGDGASVTMFYVKNGRIHYERKSISIPKPDKTLNLGWHTFRDRLTPGQQETWRLVVTDKQQKPVGGAGVMATLYDASLDELNSYTWNFRIPFVSNITSLRCLHSSPTQAGYLYLAHQTDIKSLWPATFDELSGFMLMPRFRTMGLRLAKSNLAVMETSLAAAPDAALARPVMAEAATANAKMSDTLEAETEEGATDAGDDTRAADGGPAARPALRTNFNETAFFYPRLTTNDQGQAEITFTLPESLTSWKFLGFAHTDDVHFGLITATAVAAKDFMLQPQLPRFLRTGDEATLQARIFNQTEAPLQGTATLRLLAARDEQTVVYTEDVPFSAGAAQTAVVTFHIAKGTLAEDVICEISATDGKSSDGERSLLPVLSTRELVTENIPFYIDGATTKQIDLATLFNNNSPTADSRTLSISYTDNPALDVFHSLRALALPAHDNAPCYAAALYSNMVMLHLAERLAALGDSVIRDFDRETARNRSAEALRKLQELQLPDGAWSWFKGMEGNACITLAVAEHLSRLTAYMKRFNLAENADIQTMLSDALRYLDRYEQDEFARRKENKWPLQPTDFDLRYMDICNAGPTSLAGNNQRSQMLTTYLDELARHLKDMTIYGRAKGACILRKFGRKGDARKFTESVKHYLVYKPGFGRYFATDRAHYSWQDYRIPTQLAAMRCLSTMERTPGKPAESGTEKAMLHDMQLWLLRQKQTQVWDNPLNGIEVADYLLTYSHDETVRQPDVPAIWLDQRPVALTDYSYQEEQPATPATTLTVEKHSPGISWGYVRGTFREEAEKLNDYTTGELSIEYKLYTRQGDEWVEMPTTSEPQNLKTSEPQNLRVRYIIHADRDMDFVSVRVRHPACLEPQRTRSGYQWTGTRGCYMEMHDTETCIFFDWFRRGTTTIDLDYYVTRSGRYQSGITTVQCDYAPEFGGYAHIYQLNP